MTEIALLNFASATKPGGGFLNGANAQEESIARSSGLYPCINQHQEMYQYGARDRSPLYSDYMSFSPKVPYFREDDGKLSERPIYVSMITSPAVNLSQCDGREASQAREVMKVRMRKIIWIAIEHGVRGLVLGAFGCGVFKNDPSDIARIEAELLVEEHLGQFFDLVVNPIICTRGNDRNFVAFEQMLSRCAPPPNRHA
jgi:uncharacterized protein (TIGR02452 family)